VAAQSQSAATVEMLNAVKGAGFSDPRCDAKTAKTVLEAAKAAAQSQQKLMDVAKYYRVDSLEAQEQMRVADVDIMAKLQAFIEKARALPDGADLDLNEDQLAKLAEQELLNAAKQIEAAAQRIMTIKTNVDDLLPESMRQAEVTEAILEAARGITRAAAQLVQAATVSQKELAAKGRADKSANPYKKDPAWAQGLISAAREVAGTVDLLVNCANDAAQKKAGEEHLVAATRQVAAAVARLVSASKVKADSSSQSQQKLELAARSLTGATSKFVEAARQHTVVEEEIKAKDRPPISEADAKKRVIEAASQLNALEQGLTSARQNLARFREVGYAQSINEAKRPGAKK